jgi:hypothetical protein
MKRGPYKVNPLIYREAYYKPLIYLCKKNDKYKFKSKEIIQKTKINESNWYNFELKKLKENNIIIKEKNYYFLNKLELYKYIENEFFKYLEKLIKSLVNLVKKSRNLKKLAESVNSELLLVEEESERFRSFSKKDFKEYEKNSISYISDKTYNLCLSSEFNSAFDKLLNHEVLINHLTSLKDVFDWILETHIMDYEQNNDNKIGKLLFISNTKHLYRWNKKSGVEI